MGIQEYGEEHMEEQGTTCELQCRVQLHARQHATAAQKQYRRDLQLTLRPAAPVRG